MLKSLLSKGLAVPHMCENRYSALLELSEIPDRI